MADDRSAPPTAGADADDAVVLVIGSGLPHYREYLLAGAASRHALWLLDHEPPTWQTPHVRGGTPVDPTDVTLLLAAARDVAAHRAVVGVLCYDEALILPAAHVAEALGLPGPGVGAIQRCRDKSATRQTLADAGIPQPTSTAVSTLRQARAAAEATGFPVVLKPRGLGASQGVIRVDHPRELDDAWHAASSASYPGVPTYDRGVLVEEYLDGPEVSVDAVVRDGAVLPLTVARKRLGPPPFFEEVGHTVSADDPLLTDPAFGELLVRVHAALGVRSAVTHTEVRLTIRGPRVVEVNGRLGGDMIPYLGWLARGIDHGRVAVDAALGAPVTAVATRAQAAGVRFAYPDADGRVVRVELPEGVELPGSGGARMVRLAALAEPGTVLRLPPHGYVARYAVAVCAGPTATDCDTLLDSVMASLGLDAEPLTAPVS